ncbi:unnamed protein product [Albugo candida]|uniref:Pyridine nucleotide-disulfide oxidoreductase domain-containing protein 2 n=1 Tax=Albugo candida TaxID=65357 RepID=A0A024G3V6_9STRA|nr:unnamed protein product [Albugo candida]|eukprot:CCI40989.1 unnamed protein product [Albugo candida]
MRFATIDHIIRKKWDAVIIGGGHNGLVAAAYLAKAGKQVCVLEKRHVIGGAAVTEEIFPGFLFSRASYVFSLFRPDIIEYLELKRRGLHIYSRDPGSFTPTLNQKSLLLWSDMEKTQQSIGQFSKADALMYPKYIKDLEFLVQNFIPMLDEIPPDASVLFDSGATVRRRLEAIRAIWNLSCHVRKMRGEIGTFLEFLTAPATKILNRYFESEILKTTLATDATIGAAISPSTPGSAYILFHHVMGEVNGVKGAWGYVKGGMGQLSTVIAESAQEAGAEIVVNADAQRIMTMEGKVSGVCLNDGSVIHCDCVLSNADPGSTMLGLIQDHELPIDVRSHFMRSWQCEPASTKINVALDRLPDFTCRPNGSEEVSPLPHHSATLHFEDTLQQLEDAFMDYKRGSASSRPIIEMVIPSSVDSSISPPGKHVALLFVQYTPYKPQEGAWNASTRENFARKVFNVIDQYAPGFSQSIINYEILTPPDLEEVFSLPRGNIFHGSMGLDQLFWLRPMKGMSDYRTCIRGLYLCSAGTHPGGGVMGACGRNAAMVCLRDMC